jgi:hypothetical protein
MSFFKKLFQKKPSSDTKVGKKVILPDNADDSTDPIERFEKTYNPNIFFASFDEAVADLQAKGENARAEMLLAGKNAAQKAFIDRVIQSATAQGAHLNDDGKIDTISRAIDAIRRYNQTMTTDVRAYLAQQKRQAILDISGVPSDQDDTSSN